MKKEFHISGQINQTSENGDIINSYEGSVFVDKSNNSNIPKQKSENKNNSENTEQKNNWSMIYLKIFGIVLSGAIIFWVLAIIAYKCFDFVVIDTTNVILTAVGIAATFIVVSNYIQVKEIKDEFDRKTKELEKILNQNIFDTIDDYNHTVSAITKQLAGMVYADKSPASALELYIEALEEINKAIKNKSPVDGIVEHIQALEQVKKVDIEISTDEKKRYSRIIVESKHDKTDELLDFINSIKILKL